MHTNKKSLLHNNIILLIFFLNCINTTYTSNDDSIFAQFSGLSNTTNTTQSSAGYIGGISQDTLIPDITQNIHPGSVSSAINAEINLTRNTSHMMRFINNIGKNGTPSQQKNIFIRQHISLNGAVQKITPKNKYDLPPAMKTMSEFANMGFTILNTEIKNAQNIFPNDPDLATSYQTFMTTLQANQKFVSFFKKLHITALHQIYQYLLGIYTALNMTHIDDVETFIALEYKYGLNKKTLIINHLINLIQAQLSQALLAIFPGIEKNYSIHIGTVCMKQDSATNINFLIMDIEQELLGLFGINTLSANQCMIIINVLNNQQYAPYINQINQTNLTNAQEKIKQYEQNFIQHLTIPEKQSLIDALTQISSHFRWVQQNNDLTVLINALQNESTFSNINNNQMLLFQNTIAQCAFGIPLFDQIEASETIAQKLQNPQNNPIITNKDFITLRTIVSFILLQYEQATVKELNAILRELNALNPEYTQLSPEDKEALQIIASQLINQEIKLEEITDRQRLIMTEACMAITKASNAIEAPIIQSIARELAKGPRQLSDFNNNQQATLQTLFTTWSNYKFNSHIKNIFLEDISTQDQTELKKIAQFISNKGKIKSLPKSEQIFFLSIIERIASAFEIRIKKHKILASALQPIFDNNPQATDSLMLGITLQQYATLIDVNKIINPIKGSAPTELSISQLSTEQQQALLSLFLSKDPIESSSSSITPQSTTDSNTMHQELHKLENIKQDQIAPAQNYIQILKQLKKQFSTKSILQLTQNLAEKDHKKCRLILSKLQKNYFNPTQLSNNNIVFLQQLFTQYQVLFQQDQTPPPATNADLTNPIENTIQLMRDLLNDSHTLRTLQNKYLVCLKAYLDFFEKYTATLLINDTKQNYSGATIFARHAKEIMESLNNNSNAMNPPIFFYDKDSIRGIELLPKLAIEVINTEHAPLPTFGTTLAIEGQARNPVTKKIENNMITVGSGNIIMQNHRKFFFKDKDGKDFYGSQDAPYQPDWLSKIKVPCTDKTNFNYIYKTNRALIGEEGLYTTIPYYMKDMGATKETIIPHPYEQPLYAQPDWLNEPQEIINIMRGCLGSFASIVDMHIFDPCLTMIFKKTMELDKTTSSQSTTELTQLGKACKAQLLTQQKAYEQVIPQKISTTTTVGEVS